jgi:hypothetical protein
VVAVSQQDAEHIEGEAELEEAGYEVTPTEFLVYINTLSMGRVPNGKLAIGLLLAAEMRHSKLATRFKQLQTYYQDVIALTKSLTSKPQMSLMESLAQLRVPQPVYVPAPYVQPQQQQEEKRGFIERLKGLFG